MNEIASVFVKFDEVSAYDWRLLLEEDILWDCEDVFSVSDVSDEWKTSVWLSVFIIGRIYSELFNGLIYVCYCDYIIQNIFI